jgi:hypothetical protein
MGSSEMPQAPLDAIACNRISDSTTHHEADARSIIKVPVTKEHSMNDQGGPTDSNAPSGRTPEVSRVMHS